MNNTTYIFRRYPYTDAKRNGDGDGNGNGYINGDGLGFGERLLLNGDGDGFGQGIFCMKEFWEVSLLNKVN